MKISEIKAVLSYTLDVSLEAQKELERATAEFNDLTSPEEIAAAYENVDRESVWDLSTSGCDWYCGGGPSKFTASSELSPTSKFTYSAKNAHDFDLSTAWVEGKKGYGICEYLDYSFSTAAANVPRVTEIHIYNGYHKSEKAWRDNSRVKKLKVSVNGEPYAILLLEDSRALQKFFTGPIWEYGNTEGIVMRFEILEAYPGDRWKDVAISEIEFDGVDVH